MIAQKPSHLFHWPGGANLLGRPTRTLAMITLHTFVPGWGLPDMSPFVIKVATYLRMAGFEYRTVVSDSRKAPKGKFPFIECDGQVVCDSSLIVQHLESRTVASLDAGLDARSRAVAASFRALIEEHTYFLRLFRVWCEPTGWARYRPVLREYSKRIGVPALAFPVVAALVRRDVRRRCWGQGVGRHSVAEINATNIAHVKAVADWLDDQLFFLGSGPTTIDATVFAFMATELWSSFDGPVRDYARSRPNLVAYCERIRDRYWKKDWPAAAGS